MLCWSKPVLRKKNALYVHFANRREKRYGIAQVFVGALTKFIRHHMNLELNFMKMHFKCFTYLTVRHILLEA